MASRGPSAFGLLLRRLRMAAGLTQEELAERAGVSARGISDLERGVSAASHEDTAQRLADALDIRGDERSAFLQVAREVRATAASTVAAPSTALLPPARGDSHSRRKPGWIRPPPIPWIAGRFGIAAVSAMIVGGALVSVLLYALGAPQRRVLPLPTHLVAVWGGQAGNSGHFQQPLAVAVDRGGRVYIADFASNTVQQLSSTGEPLVQWGRSAGTARFQGPDALAVDLHGNIYVLDQQNERLQKISPAGTMLKSWTVTGNGVAVDQQGTIYLVDGGENNIHVLSTSGITTNVYARCGNTCGLYRPSGIAVDTLGEVYVTDTDNNRLVEFSRLRGRLVDTRSIGFPRAGLLPQSSGVAVDLSGDIYVADTTDARILKLSPQGTILSQWGAAGHLRGAFSSPQGIAVDRLGDVYIADPGRKRIDKLSPRGALVATWTATGSKPVHFDNPAAIAVDRSGAVYILDGLVYRIQRFSAAGQPLPSWNLSSLSGIDPLGLTIDSHGNLYFAHSGFGKNVVVDRLSADGHLAGTLRDCCQVPVILPNGHAICCHGSAGLTVDGRGHLWGAFYESSSVLEDAGGKLLAWGSEISILLSAPTGVAVDSQGHAFVTEANNNTIDLLGPPGSVLHRWGGFGSGPTEFYHPSGIAIDGYNRLYVADTDNNRVKIVSETGQTLAILGRFGRGSGEFNAPTGIALDGRGNLYVLDAGNSRVEKFAPTG